jgi:hypothetical protein
LKEVICGFVGQVFSMEIEGGPRKKEMNSKVRALLKEFE